MIRNIYFSRHDIEATKTTTWGCHIRTIIDIEKQKKN